MDIPKQWLHIGNNHIDINLIEDIRNAPLFPKPDGGFWASPFRFGTDYYSEWQGFSEYIWGKTKNEKAVIFYLKRNARVYSIDSQEDLIRLINEVGSVENPFPIKTTTILEFEKAKEYYDVIYLTSKGQQETRNPFSKREYKLTGWDCESCLILNPMVIGKQMPVSI
ncbi:hypothetical protein CVD28_01170 [Bacillus sp. M6-12]|uniref:hypothetical protein n=1 Tax=Bacillus sp. M6-12 TaxID=2054166 RepID=UPI000C75D62D|nr:hypothetical protein [Bacillus sp. M6-12]PLS19044.1 hypothetical protein CVD28_01170 [Bacillus sp. M6-12]